MKACVKAWQTVINPTTGKVHDEIGLRYVGAIRYGPVREVTIMTDGVADKMVTEFEKLNPDFRYDQLEIYTKE